MYKRLDGRTPDTIRELNIIPHYLKQPPGSCLIEMGGTRVVCSAMIEESVPPFLKGSGKGWLTAEYSMLPASSKQRIQRERAKIGGRTHEIQRLIGRSLRTCVDLSLLGERSILVDCDVLDADGGTRTASITGAYVAVSLAIRKHPTLVAKSSHLVRHAVGAISVGVVGGVPLLDLNYEEDKNAEVDMNVVRTSRNQFIEIQGTAELMPFSDDEMKQMLDLARVGIDQLLAAQRKVLES